MRELRETVRSRFFISTSVLFGAVIIIALVLLAVIQFIPADSLGGPDADDLIGITGDQSDSIARYTVMLDDRSGSGLLQRLSEDNPLVDYQPQTLTDAAVRSAFEAGADGCLIISQAGEALYYLNPFDFELELTELVQTSLDTLAREDAIAALGVSYSDAAAILEMTCPVTFSEVSNSDLLTPPDSEDGGGFFSQYTETGATITVYLISSLMFMAISFYGQMVSSRVMHEKSTRMVEVLASSATPTQLLCGKVLGVGTAGFSQIFLFYALLLAIGGAALGRLTALFPDIAQLVSEMFACAADNALYILIFMLLGFAQLAFVYGGLGAMSSDTETVSGFAAIPLHLPMLGYFIAMMAPALSGSAVLTAASFVPVFSPFAMLARLGVEQVAGWEVIISMLLQLACVIMTAILAARLYRRGMLRYGQPPKLRELITTLRK